MHQLVSTSQLTWLAEAL